MIEPIRLTPETVIVNRVQYTRDQERQQESVKVTVSQDYLGQKAVKQSEKSEAVVDKMPNNIKEAIDAYETNSLINE